MNLRSNRYTYFPILIICTTFKKQFILVFHTYWYFWGNHSDLFYETVIKYSSKTAWCTKVQL